MTSSSSPQEKSTLTFNGDKYEMDSLPKEALDLVKAAQIADAQLKMQEDNLKLLTVARQTIAQQLVEKLKDVPKAN